MNFQDVTLRSDLVPMFSRASEFGGELGQKLAVSSRSVRILHLEDSLLDSELVKWRIAHAGFEFTFERVEDRETFRSRLDQARFDLILADYSLPDFDGVSALELVRKRWPNLPFIFVSGTLGEELAIETLRRGRHRFRRQAATGTPGSVDRGALAESLERDERLRAETALKQSNEQLALALETAGMWTWRIELPRPMEAPANKNQRSREPRDLRGLAEFLWRIHPDDRDAVHSAIEETAASGGVFSAEYRLWEPGGFAERWVLSKGKAECDHDGRPQACPDSRSTSPTEKPPRRCSENRIAARTNSWRCWRTSSETRSQPSPVRRNFPNPQAFPNKRSSGPTE